MDDGGGGERRGAPGHAAALTAGDALELVVDQLHQPVERLLVAFAVRDEGGRDFADCPLHPTTPP